VRAIERLLATLPPRGGGVLRRRGGHPPQPADWAGLDGAGRAEDGADARAERQALPGRALHPRTGEVVWVGNGRKNSHLFLHLLRRLVAAFPGARKLHVIRDNYGIHSSRLVQYAVTHEFHGRIVLHFLPPYSPQHNRIERLWRELHANVTRNHRCRTLPELLRRVAAFLRRVSPYPGTQVSLLRAPKRRAA
jgi:transposase